MKLSEPVLWAVARSGVGLTGRVVDPAGKATRLTMAVALASPSAGECTSPAGTTGAAAEGQMEAAVAASARTPELVANAAINARPHGAATVAYQRVVAAIGLLLIGGGSPEDRLGGGHDQVRPGKCWLRLAVRRDWYALTSGAVGLKHDAMPAVREGQR